ncbi:MAG: prepilin peptidase, partial [Mariprofundaceae bacterium]|nr:prepilin peptidase [Mariprofundaceae bacterium]
MVATLSFIALAALVGLMVGSFCNVCVYRIPRGESVAWPGSHCPNCQHTIAWYDNIPLLSWAWLGGSCRHCSQAIAIRYPALEAVVAISWGYLTWVIGPSPVLLQAVVLMTLLWVLTLIDLETMFLPDVLTLPGIAIGLGFAAWLGYFTDALIG